MKSDTVTPFAVNDTSCLFFQKYPYRVSFTNPAERYYIQHEWDGEESYTNYSNRVAGQMAVYDANLLSFVNNFKYFFDQNENHEHCDVRANKAFVHFYFTREEDYSAFEQEFAQTIEAVTRPSENFDCAQLNTRHAVKQKFRKDAFFGKYNWKVSFNKTADTEDLDEWVSLFFAGDTTRYHYDPSNKQRSLYLCSDMDVAVTRISQNNNITTIEEIV